MMQGQNLKAAFLAMAASAILSFIDNFVYAVSQEAGLWQFQVVRSLIALPVLVATALFLRVQIRPKNLIRTMMRSLLVASGLLVYFATLGVLPVAQAAAGLFTAPLWILVFSAVFFGVRVGVWQFLLMALGFVGVVLILGIHPASLTFASLLPIIAGVFYGLGMLATRHWCKDENALTLVIGIFTTMGLFSAAILTGVTLWPLQAESNSFLLQGWVTPSPLFFLLTLSQAIGAIIAVSMITQAYRIGDPGFVAVFEYSFLIFAALWTFLLWGQGTSPPALLGIAVILVSGGVLSLMGRKAG